MTTAVPLQNTLEALARLFAQVALAEEQALRALPGKHGFFHMPELAFAYACGKAAMAQAADIFAPPTPRWARELKLGNGGPTDLVFSYPNGQQIAIEFKMRTDTKAYLADLDKLGRLGSNTCKLFCTAIDLFADDRPDGRISAIGTAPGHRLRLLNRTDFSTDQDKYKAPVKCALCTWQLI